LGQLIQLEKLTLKSNQIKSVKPLKSIIESFNKLKRLEIYDNPFSEELQLTVFKNNLDEVRKYFSDKKLKPKQFKLPPKLMFLGNHAAGKSTFLHYLQKNKLPKEKEIEKIKNTHILKIEKFEKLPAKYKQQEETAILPDAMIYDFGGHDYYHGIYRAFFSEKPITLLMWCEETDNNKVSETKQIQNFKRNYWLHQLKLFTQGTVFMVQTHADEDKRKNYLGSYSDFNIHNEYYISLKEKYIAESKHRRQLDHLKEDLFQEISEKRNASEEYRPKYYEQFLKYIIYDCQDMQQCVKVEDIFKGFYVQSRERNKGEKEEDLRTFLKVDLNNLSKTGLIIYYNNDKELNDVVWLNPQKTIEYIHDNILNKNIIFKINDTGKIPEDAFDKLFDTDDKKKIKKLLVNQKVIFHDKHEKRYIIPGYLPLLSPKDSDYQMMTLGLTPNYTLRFKNFLPFGLINQLICLYGGQPDFKNFWRDRLIFTFDKAYKVLIILDFSNLEIKVHIHECHANKKRLKLHELEKLILLNIIDLYNDDYVEYCWEGEDENKVLNIKSSKDKTFEKEYIDLEGKEKIKENTIEKYIQREKVESPEDLYISVDGKSFVHHQELEGIENYQSNIAVYTFKPDTPELDAVSHHTKPVYLYKNFSNNKQFQNVKKIFISYSKEDKAEMHEFLKHTVTLQEQGLIAKPWTDEWIAFGKEWDEEIKHRIEECDIMVCLVSVDFLNTEYIRKIELKEAVEQSKVLVPIIIKPCDWKNCNFAKYQVALKGKCINLYENEKYVVKENTGIERAQFWVNVISEMREKIFNETN